MKRLLMAALMTGMLTASAPDVANAVCVHGPPPHVHSGACDSPSGYTGGCRSGSVNDTTPGGQLGGQDVWNGAIWLVVIPTDPGTGLPTGEDVTASCELRVNGVSQGTVLGPVSGSGAVFAAGSFTYTAAITDIVSICDHVTTSDGTTTVSCRDLTTTQVVPQPVVDLLEMVGVPLVCAALIAAAPTVDATFPPDVMYIDPATGDWFVGGTTSPDNLFWDCPPYVS